MSTPKVFPEPNPTGRAPGGTTGARPLRRRRVLLLASAGALAAAAAMVALWPHPRPRTRVEALAREDGPRPFTVRLSTQRVYHPCTAASPQGPIPSADCAAAPYPRATRRVRALRGPIESAADSGIPDGIHARALLALTWSRPENSELSRVVEQLTGLVNAGGASADVLSDLSGVLLVRAGREETIGDVWRAVDLAESALERSPAHPRAQYNLALALEAATLGSVAADAWATYLRLDSTSGYAGEARRRMRRLQQAAARPAAPQSSDSALAAYASANRLRAREMGQAKLLGSWGEAVLRNDPRAAETALHQAGVIGETLERLGGDASLSDAVRSIHGHAGDVDALRRLASAHSWYAKGREAVRTYAFVVADSCFDRVYAEKPPSKPLIALTRITNAVSHRGADSTTAVRMLEEALDSVDARRYPALAGNAYYTLGTLRSKGNDFATASSSFAAALPLLERSGEEENIGGVLLNYAEADRALGRRVDGYAKAYKAASLLRRTSALPSLHVALANLSRWLAEDGLENAALRVNDEDVAVARWSAVSAVIVEARDNRADNLARQGDTRAALAEVAAAEPLLDSLDRRARDHFSAMLDATRGIINVEANPRLAEAQLTQALRFMTKPAAGVPQRMISVLLARADARVALDETDSARADSEWALALIEKAAREPGATGLNRELTADVRLTLYRIAGRLAAEGRSPESLQLLENGAATLGHGPAGTVPTRWRPGETVLRYALVGDTLLAWTLSSRGLDLTRTAVRAGDLAARIARVRNQLSDRNDRLARQELRQLYATLISPVSERLRGADSSLVIVPDGSLAGVPFSALLDPSTHEYLIQQHPIRRAATLEAAASASASRMTGVARTAAVVVDPAFDPRAYPELGRLPGAQQESAYVATWMGAPPLSVSGAQATAGALRRLLPRIAVLHFGGHAISDEDYPDSSFLVLARGSAGSSRLTAAEIAGMQLGGLDLVVLSACRTLNDSRGGAGGFTGLGGAFLAAGARGVIGSLWEVKDAETSALMRRFYTSYDTTPDAAAALRRAQLDMLTNGTPGERAPSAWAGFEYAGR